MGDAGFLIPVAGLLSQLASGLDDRDLPLDLVLDSLFQRAERVHVLDLDFGTEPFGTFWSDRYVGIEANRALFEPRIGGTQLGYHRPQILGIRPGFGGAADVWPGNHLDQWDARAVEVEQSRFRGVNPPAIADVSRFAGVLLHVGTLDADPSGLTVDRDIEVAVMTDRDVELGDLIALGEVCVEVVLAVEDRTLRHLAIDGKADRHDPLDGLSIRNRECPRQTKTDRACVGVGLRPKLHGAATEHLRSGGELDMHLDPDHGLPGHEASSSRTGRSVKLARLSTAAAT